MKRIATGLLSLIIATSFTVTAMADTSNIDLNTLWDFSQPALSEQPQALAVQVGPLPASHVGYAPDPAHSAGV